MAEETELVLRKRETRRRWRENNPDYHYELSPEQRERKNALERERHQANIVENRTKNREAMRRWYAANRDKAQERARAAYRADPAKAIAIVRRRQAERVDEIRVYAKTRHLGVYGLTLEDYEALYAIQGGVCAVCSRPESKRHSRSNEPLQLSVDHDHETGAVRGLLCGACNMALGLLQDEPDRLRAAIEYLEVER